MEPLNMEPLNVPPRKGPRPDTTNQLPHSQLNQHGPEQVIQQLHTFCFSFPEVNNEPSAVAPRGTRAMILDDHAHGNHHAFMIGREFAHIHPYPDNGSMHLMLSETDAIIVINSGWGEDHYLVTHGYLPKGLILVFSPRDDEELNVLKTIVTRSYAFATS